MGKVVGCEFVTVNKSNFKKYNNNNNNKIVTF